MIDCIFTLDYEIYGNGEGSLRELVYEPTNKLKSIFDKWNARFVVFAEAAELEKIAEHGTDSAIEDVRRQVRGLYAQGYEIGLHLHPQWYNARYANGRWLLDYSEYNLCTLPRGRIVQLVDRSIAHLREMLGASEFRPLSFRAGNWLLQPTLTAAAVLSEAGIKVDSSVFKGGLQRAHRLDYRRALRNGYYWPFQHDVNLHDHTGLLIEIPTFTTMVPIWKMFTSKRIGLQRRSRAAPTESRPGAGRYLDYLRFMYPKKLDYCRMTYEELVSMIERVIEDDRKAPEVRRPIVAIGHTKDLIEYDVIDRFLSYLRERGISVATFNDVYSGYLACR